ncbi:MAG TPA: hypothetical protein VGX76_15650, partial [Pirellulales bacterium]|jgi:hypothetical protein|nr:hypothetical protein [Pirellulales bacterium]
LYLLPCTCGKKIEVDAGQAGLSVRCSCGADVPVPTMRGLALLERTEPRILPSEGPSTDWGRRQGLIFLGLVIMLAASLGGLYVWWVRPILRPWTDEAGAMVRAPVVELNLEKSWELWKQLRQGPDAQHNIGGGMEEFLMAERRSWVWLEVLGGVLLVGAVVVVAGLFTRKGRRDER